MCRTGTRREISVIDFSVVASDVQVIAEPICGICKLFGDHKFPTPVAKISDAYAERKVNFAKDRFSWCCRNLRVQHRQCWYGSYGSCLFLQQQGNVWLPFK